MSNNPKDNRTQESPKPNQERGNDINQGQKDPHKQKDGSHESGEKSQKLPGESDDNRRSEKDSPKMGERKDDKTQRTNSDNHDDRQQDSDKRRTDGPQSKKN